MVFTVRHRPTYERVLNLPIEARQNNGDTIQCDHPLPILTPTS